jgi:hypothetical protein
MKKRIKITEHGTAFDAAKRVPMIRFRGHWLSKAGFAAKSHLQLTVVSPGIIELRAANGSWQQPPEPSKDKEKTHGRIIKCPASDFGKIIGQDFETECPAVAVEFIGTGQPITDITVVLDRSASMASKAAETVKAFNELVAEQRQIGVDAVLTLVQFNEVITTTFEAVDIDSVEPLTSELYVPSGNTALLDGIGVAIEQANGRVSSRGDQVVVIIAILTDGVENASRRFTREAIFDLIETKQQKHGWNFLFLGASQEAIQESAALGIAADATLAYENTGKGTEIAFASASSSIKRLREGEKRNSFSSEKRSAQSKLRRQQRRQRPSKN